MFSGSDDLSLLDSDLVDVDPILTPGQVTDSYLLALAVKNRGELAISTIRDLLDFGDYRYRLVDFPGPSAGTALLARL